MNLLWVYQSFFLRDLLGFVVPGAIVLGSFSLTIDPMYLRIVPTWPWGVTVAAGIPLSYVTGLCIYHIAVFLRLSVSDHTTFLGIDPDRTFAGQLTNKREPGHPPIFSLVKKTLLHFLACFLYYPSGTKYEKSLEVYYASMAQRDPPDHLRAQINRQSVVKQACGQFGIAFVIVSAACCCIEPPPQHDSSYIAHFMRLATAANFRLLIVIAAFVLFLAHLRHARFQFLMTRAFQQRLTTRSSNSDNTP